MGNASKYVGTGVKTVLNFKAFNKSIKAVIFRRNAEVIVLKRNI